MKNEYLEGKKEKDIMKMPVTITMPTR